MKTIKIASAGILLFIGLLVSTLITVNSAQAGDLNYIWKDYGNFSLRGEKDRLYVNKVKHGSCTTYQFNVDMIVECSTNSGELLAFKPKESDFLRTETINGFTYKIYNAHKECDPSGWCTPDEIYFLEYGNNSYLIQAQNINDFKNGLTIKFNKVPTKVDTKGEIYSWTYVSPKRENLSYELAFKYNPKKLTAQDYYEQGQGSMGIRWYAGGANLYKFVESYPNVKVKSEIIATVVYNPENNSIADMQYTILQKKAYGANTLVKYKKNSNNTVFTGYYIVLSNKKIVTLSFTKPLTMENINDSIQISSITVKDIKKANAVKPKVETFKNTPGSITEVLPVTMIYPQYNYGFKVDILSVNSEWRPGDSSSGDRYLNQNKQLRTLTTNKNTQYRMCKGSVDVSANKDDMLNLINKRMEMRYTETSETQPEYDANTVFYFDITDRTINKITEICLP